MNKRLIAFFAFALLSALSQPLLAQTTPALLAPPPATVCTSTTVPTQPGTIHMWPGRWSNPNRAGIGWDFFYGDGEQSMYLTWFVFDQNNRPIWLHGQNKAVQFNAVTGERTWQSNLYKINWNPQGSKTYIAVGSVSVTMPRDTSTRAAVRWSWPEVDTQVHDECLFDRRDPQALTRTTSDLNEAHSSNWFYDAPTESPLNGWGVDLLISLLHPAANTIDYVETATAGIFDAANQPVWLQSDDDWGSTAPPADTFSMTSRGQLRYLWHKAGATHPAVTDCSTADCVFVRHEDHGTDGAANRFLRNITSGRRGTMSLKATVPAAKTGIAEIQWPPPNNATPFPNPIPVFRFDANQVMVDRSVCRVPSAGTKCTFTVSWVSDDAAAAVYRVDLKHNSLRTQVANGQSGTYAEDLSVDDRIQYELSYVSDIIGWGISRTPEVRVLLDGQIADEIVVPNNDLGTHDPTVGALAGEASVEGGAAAYTIPIAVPPGRNGMQPELSLVYNSRSGNGIAGIGWSLSGLSSIHRCPKTVAQDGINEPVRYEATDRLCLDGQRLVPMSGWTYGADNAEYRTELNSFVRVKQIGSDASSNRCFRVELKSGRILHFGGVITGSTCAVSAASVKPAVSNGTPLPLSWLLAKVEDRVGNTETYTYQNQGFGETTLSAINYTGAGSDIGTRKVVFSYENRPGESAVGADWGGSYMAGGYTLQSRRLTRIDTYVDFSSSNPNASGEHVRAYKLDYTSIASGLKYSLHSGRSLLASVTECGYTPQYGETEWCKAPTTFSWLDFPVDHMFKRVDFDAMDPSPIPPASLDSSVAGTPRDVKLLGDFDGDGSREVFVNQRNANDGQRHFYLVKYTADRQLSGAVDVTSLMGENGSGVPLGSDEATVDVDGDGRADLITGYGSAQLAMYVSKQARGAPFSGNPTDLFRRVTLTIPWAQTAGKLAGDRFVGAFDADGDGYTDIVAIKAGGSCNSANPGSTSTLCVYKNQSKTPLAAGTSIYNFDAGTMIDAWSGSADLLAQQIDVNGDGITDFLVNKEVIYSSAVHRFMPDRFLLSNAGARAVQSGCTSMSSLYMSCDVSLLNLPKAKLQDERSQFLWLDINGDGLSDLVFAEGGATELPANSGQYPQWIVHLNTGKGFTDPIGVMGGQQALVRDGSGTGYRYFGKTPIMDVDGDGRPEILYPVALAAQMCVFATYQYDATHELSCPDGATRAPTTDAVTGMTTCQVFVCPEDPVDPPRPANPGDPPPPPLPGHFRLPPNVNGYGVVGAYSRGYRSATFNFSGTDTSSYEMGAIRFVQTGANSFQAVTVSLDAVQGDPVNRKTHKFIANLSSQPDGKTAQDLYGDGLPDVITHIGCRWRAAPVGTSSIDNHCVAQTGTYGPSFLPDGTDVNTLAGTASPLTSGLRLYVNENVGALERSGTAPMLPELISSVRTGLNDLILWNYFPLSSTGYRTAGQLPLYQVDPSDESNYVDARHFYFQSSMPVVATMNQNNGKGGLTGARSWRYGYQEAMYNHMGRGFQGFRRIIQEQIDSSASNVLRSVTTFHQKYPLAGKVEKIVTGVPNSTWDVTPISEETTLWGCNVNDRNAACDMVNAASPVDFPYVKEKVTKNYDLASAEAGSQVLVSTSTVRNYDQSAAGPASGWDAYGNLKVQETEAKDNFSDGSQGNFVNSKRTKTENVYLYDQVGNWWLDKLDTTTVTAFAVDYSTSHPLPADATTPTQSLKTKHTWDPTTRLIQQIDVLPADTNLASSTTYTYPSPNYGLPSDIDQWGKGIGPDSYSIAHRITHIDYDGSTYLPWKTTVGKASLGGTGLATIASYRARDGQIAGAVDPTGVATINDYDAFGRLIKVSKNVSGAPLGQPVTIAWTKCAYAACPGVGEGGNNALNAPAELYAKYRVTTVQNGSPTQVVWYDMLGRAVKQAKRGFDGTFIATASNYDSMGRVDSASVPYFLTTSTSTPAFGTATTYDRLGRPVSKTAPGNELDSAHGDVLTSYSYVGNRTDITVKGSKVNCAVPGNLCMTMQRYQGVLGMMRTVDAQGGITRYWYDAAGRPIAIADANTPAGALPTGWATVASYNELGQRTKLSDANEGTWTFSYNPLGELVTQKDGRGWLTAVWQRDGLGRPLVQVDQTNTTMDTQGNWSNTQWQRDEWVYDPVTGALTDVRRCASYSGACTAGTPDWSEHYAYDGAGRITDTTTKHSYAITDVTRFLYDANFGREKAVVYPSGLRVQTRYGAYGDMVDQIDADTGARFWGIGAEDAWGNPTLEWYGNGLIGEYEWSATTGQSLSRQWRGGEASGTQVLDRIGYSYDSFGNLISQTRTNALIGATTESYQYDRLQRLSLASTPSASVSYGYDALGNLKWKSDFSQQVDGAYNYTAANSSGSFCGRNMAKQVTSAQGALVTYKCDQNGNVLSNSSPNADYPERVIGYDTSNRPLSIQTIENGGYKYASVFAYAPDGQRVHESLTETVPNTTTPRTRFLWRAPRGYEGESINFPPTNSDCTFRHEIGDAVVLLRSTDAHCGTVNNARTSEVYYRHADRLGSPLALTNRNREFAETPEGGSFASQPSRRSFDAFGMARNADFSARPRAPQAGSLGLAPATRNGFTGHEHLDNVGVIHMNGRAYDYRMGRFLSVDPLIQFPANSQSLNPYSYIMNNPLSGADPTGYQVASPDTICGRMAQASGCGGVSSIQVASRLDGRLFKTDGGGIYRAHVDSKGTISFETVRTENGAKNHGTKLPSQIDGSRNGPNAIDGVERDTFREGAKRAADTGKSIAEVSGKILEAVNPADPVNLAIGVGGRAAGGLIKAGGGMTMRQLARRMGIAEEEIDALMGTYRSVGGHHVHAKAAFKGGINYDPREGFAISQEFMERMHWDHVAMTRFQRQAFDDLAHRGVANTMQEHSRIAVDALVAGGASRDEARSLVAESLRNLRGQGVSQPSGIPWNQ